MSKSKLAAALDDQPSKNAETGRNLAPWAKVLISVLVVGHLAAVVAPPLAFACRGQSPFVQPIARFLAPYCGAMFLDHGYAFFAPNPGPNHLVDYTVEFADGRQAVKGRFPDLKEERPRLLYHRHFMLSESLNNRFAPETFDPEPSPPPLTATQGERERFAVMKADYEKAKARWQRARQQYLALRTSVEEHLKSAYGGERVKLVRIEHAPADPDAVMYERRPLNAPESYREMPETASAGGGR